MVDKCSKGRYQPLLLLYALPQHPTIQNGYQSDVSISTPNSCRRAITPSPEKPPMGLTRRAITPTPSRAMSEYQNLSVIQSKIFGNEDKDVYISRRTVESVINAQYQNLNVIQEKIFYGQQNMTSSGSTGSGSSSEEKECYLSKNGLNAQLAKKQQLNLHRSLSAESTSISTSPSHSDGLSIPEHLNQPRRRDSGNWSGDRNSASSSSSTTLDNPYMFLMNKRSNASMPPSPTRQGFFDAGYDSYSLSSTDSYPPKHPNNIHLAKIPESVVLSGDCEKLCMEADQLLEKSKLVEDAHDLETALVLCNAAAGKARAAMDAPYSNPHTMTFARMKHNTCIMRARSLYRRILIEKGGEIVKEQTNMNTIVRHARQNSKDKTGHNRQSSKELIQCISMDKPATKSIEIYATLPKKKVALKLMESDDIVSIETSKPERESRSIFGRSKDSKEKRSRSEDRNKVNRDFQVEPNLINAKDTLKKHKEKEEKEEKKEKDKSGKKQHKIRRKLLMGGLIRRKNRSMPDLTEGNDDGKPKEQIVQPQSVDDSSVGINGKKEPQSGYLSEGHFDYHVSNPNVNLERSKLMRKSFHGSGRQLTMAKVPPPPPLRKTSALTRELVEEHHMQQKQQINPNHHYYNQQQLQEMKPFHEASVSLISNMSSNTSMSEDSCQTIITTCAVVHQEQSPPRNGEMGPPQNTNMMRNHQRMPIKNESVDEVDHIGVRYGSNMDLPPYPSPPSTSCHSRQASEDFPPPPPCIDLEPLNEQLNEIQNLQTKRSDSIDSIQGCTSILAHLQIRQDKIVRGKESKCDGYSSENWLKELQLKQMALNSKKIDSLDNSSSCVKDIASRFEQTKAPISVEAKPAAVRPVNVRTGMNGLLIPGPISHLTLKPKGDSTEEVEYAIVDKKRNQIKYDVPQMQLQEELREVEMLNAQVHNTLNNSNLANIAKRTKKKSVSFCDQVILVATANNEEDDSFVPNPILERVLNSINKTSDLESRDIGPSPVDQKLLVAKTPQYPQDKVIEQGSMSGPSATMMQQQTMQTQQQMNQNNQQSQINQMNQQFVQQPQNYHQLPSMQQSQQPYNGNFMHMNGFNGNIPEQQPMVYQSVPNPNMPNNHMYVGQQQASQPRYTQQEYARMHNELTGMKKPEIATVAPNQHLQMNPNYQQPYDYNGNQGHQVLPNVGIPMQQSPPQGHQMMGNPSPYMQIPQNSAIVRDNASGYPTNISNNQTAQRPNYPQLLQQQHQMIQRQMMYNNSNGNVYQKPTMNHAPMQNMPTMPGMPMMQQNGEFNGYNYQTPYQRVPFPQQGEMTNMQAFDQPMNLHQGISQQNAQNPQNSVYMNPNLKNQQKKVSFGPDTKGGPDNCPSPTISVQTTASNSSNNSNVTDPNQSQVIPTKVSISTYNNTSIIKASAKAVQCNLCRKKSVQAPSTYCADCEFYMMRFQPRR